MKLRVEGTWSELCSVYPMKELCLMLCIDYYSASQVPYEEQFVITGEMLQQVGLLPATIQMEDIRVQN